MTDDMGVSEGCRRDPAAKIRWLAEQQLGQDYIRFRLREETDRARRYDHVFSVVCISSPGVTARELGAQVQRRIRGSDIVSPVGSIEPPDGGTQNSASSHGAVAVILPETGERAAAAAMDRLRRELRTEGVRMGFAVYPRDASVSRELLKLARLRQAPGPSDEDIP